MANTALQSRTLSAKDMLRNAVLQLQSAHITTASMDARVLLQYVLGVTREQLLADTGLQLSPRQQATYEDLVQRRCERQPVSHLIGKREFWNLTFKVTPDTLDPRPDSETLIEALLSRFPDREAPLKILDLGTGTGCLLLTLLSEYPAATGTGVDISPPALEVARENALNLGLENRADWLRSCWGNDVEGSFDIVISNPPYIPTHTIATLAPEVARWEPRLALDGGEDGMACYRAIAAQLPRLLAPKGYAAFEIGIGQARELGEVVTRHGLQVACIKDDLACIARCVLVTHSNSTKP
jgi:release factor glutamine methyltransferase